MQGKNAIKTMNKEQLISKGVKHAFNGKETLFSVDSLKEHFDGLQIHESDILTDEFEDQDEGYVKVSDVNFDFATINIVISEEIDENDPYFWSQDDEDEEVLKQRALEEEQDLKIQPEDPAFGTEGIVSNKTPEMADEEIKELNKELVLDPDPIVNDIVLEESSFETLSDGPESPEPPQEEIGLPKPREPKKSKTSKK